MRIGITGDTHADTAALRQVVKLAPPVECWLHTGDHAEDAAVLGKLTGLEVTKVLGNCDRNPDLANIDEIIVIEGFKIWLTHGHRYMGHTRLSELVWWAKQLEVDIVVYGHTHIPMFEYHGEKLLINPGSPSRPRGGSKPSFAVLTLKKGEEPKLEFIELPQKEKFYTGIFRQSFVEYFS